MKIPDSKSLKKNHTGHGMAISGSLVVQCSDLLAFPTGLFSFAGWFQLINLSYLSGQHVCLQTCKLNLSIDAAINADARSFL